ncbi:ABC transporter ATP-binding protein [Mycoplasma sp. 527]
MWRRNKKVESKNEDLNVSMNNKKEISIASNADGISGHPLDSATLKKYKLANNKPRKKDGLEKEKNSDGNIVEVFDVKKTYLSGNVATDVLKGVSLTIKKGEIAILYGKSGSGKSTLLNIISALDRPTSGKVIVNNINLPYLNESRQTLFRRDNISFIFQNYNLLQNLNSYDNVETGAYLQKDKSKHLDIKKLFKDFDLEECMFKYPSQISGGQQQRVSILRAIAKNSDILVADEPTGALDEKTGWIVLKILQEINRDYGTTIIIVSHDADVAQIADKVIYLELGHIKDIKHQERKWLIKKEKEN